ncbi:MAG: hypothetical protein HQK94_14825 [Nitrospirae bacterium]|nr:hypothetical protein [Nitrospirota bacterium]
MFNAFKEEYRRNADRLLTKINALRLQCNLDMHTNVSFNINSGFRNPIHNAKYAPNSQHLTGNAIDIRDVNGSLAMWCLNHINIINNDYNFSMECPLKTNGWVHLDNRPVRANPNPIKMLNRTKNAKCNACNSCPRF